MKAATQARRMVYTAVNMAHFQPPLSFFMATNVAMHGKYRRMKTMYARAPAGVTERRRAFWRRVSPEAAFTCESEETEPEPEPEPESEPETELEL